MKDIWKYRRLELITWIVFAVLVSSSLSILYKSYSDYNDLLQSATQVGNIYEYKIIMFISSFILFLSLVIIYQKRDYFFLSSVDNTEALEQLLEDIKLSSDSDKIREFKAMLKKKNHIEIYPLISNMINELQESKKLADEANQIKTLFLSNMSHEIRTPLNSIVGFTKLLKSTKLNLEQLDFVSTILHSSEDLISIIDDILDISKLESGKVELEESYFNIIDEFENMIETYAKEASKKDIDFSIWLDPEFSSELFKSDAKKIKQVLINLISNAIKFTPNNGSVDISIEKVGSKEEKTTIKFTITDTGIGIPQEYKDRVFDAFTQVDDSSIRQYGGTGLGLTISTSLVRILGGTLTLNSKLNKGTTISFSLDMPHRIIIKECNYKPMKIALYSPHEMQIKKSDKYLERYLSSFKDIYVNRFKTFIECQGSKVSSFNVLYIHYDDIDKKELKRLVARHSSDNQIVLITKLKNRENILDIAPIFSQIVYEPISFSKIENSIEILSKNKREIIDDNQDFFYGLRALVIEDNPINANMIMGILESMGISSDNAINGKIGVDMYQNNHYDIVFMDIQMPVMNGVDTTKVIIKYELENKLPHIPIIAVTTNSLKGDRERYLEIGMDDYIAKPIDLNKFITVIKQFYSTNTVNLNEKNVQKDILLYKETPTESKIVGTILQKFGYSIDIAKNINEFINMVNNNKYKSLILDKSASQSKQQEVSKNIKDKGFPSLLFIDKNEELISSDTDTYTHIIDKSSDFTYIKDKLDSMM
ncbi:MAG: response regulator [Sulfurovaceae bacterium]|nr:response regulator [Sulfurovaceae bacterium]